MNLKAIHNGQNVTLHDICFKPMAPQHPECAVFSVAQYFQNNETLINYWCDTWGVCNTTGGAKEIQNWRYHLHDCMR